MGNLIRSDNLDNYAIVTGSETESEKTQAS
jgi:hypothetical protein